MTHLFLTGFMGTGTVGPILAERLHVPFVDCTAEIERAADKSIARILAEDGVPALRTLEARILASLVKGENAVIALDDRALHTVENYERIRQAGPLVWMAAESAALVEQVSAPTGHRTSVKVAEPLVTIRESFETRQPSYVTADVQFNTANLDTEQVVEHVFDWLSRVRVNLGERSYEIRIEEGCHAAVGPFLASLPDTVSSVVIISNRDIDRLFGDTLRLSLDSVGLRHNTLLVPAGERFKSLETAGRLYGDLMQRKTDRKSVVLALGGGVIGDLAGFVAATYERGVRFLQVPTSLLAHVDSSVGGKVGVNHAHGKNMIGAFLQPLGVFIDPACLSSLPVRELRSGLAEVIKYGVIWDADFFGYLENHVDQILRLDTQAIRHVIRRSCQIKAHVVEEDERETSLRAILNFGHTVAHAVETYTSYERYTHGEAVAIGMVVAARIAHGMGLLRAEPVHRITRLLERFGLPTHLPKADPGVLMSLMDTDKKAEAGKVRFVLPSAIGRVEITSAVTRDILRRAIKESIEL